MEYIGHGNAGLVLKKDNEKFLKFIPCVSYNDCIAIAGMEGLCTSSVASTQVPVFPKRNKCTILNPEEFQKHWLQKIKNFPFPKRWLQSCKKTNWDTFPWHVLLIESSEFLYPLKNFLPQSQEEFDYVFFSLLKAIQQMQESFQMVHGDLHLDNVMVRLTPKETVKQLTFRLGNEKVLLKKFQDFAYDVIVVDWEKAISPKLFGWKTTHAHLQRMMPLFYKHKMDLVPMQYIDLEMLRTETLPNLSQGKYKIPEINIPEKDPGTGYSIGLYPTHFLGIQDPTWITLQFCNPESNENESPPITISVFPPKTFDIEILPEWESQEDFLENFEKEYFLYNRPMHRYNLPPFDWERKQFCELKNDILKEYNIDISSWPTSIPRPIRKPGFNALDILNLQKKVILDVFLKTSSEASKYLKDFLKT